MNYSVIQHLSYRNLSIFALDTSVDKRQLIDKRNISRSKLHELRIQITSCTDLFIVPLERHTEYHHIATVGKLQFLLKFITAVGSW